MRFASPLVAGRFISRDNRFRATVDVDGQVTSAHVPNSGRLHELLIPGAELRLKPAFNSERLTSYDLLLVRTATGWASIDARLPPRLLGEWISRGDGSFLGWTVERAEVVEGRSRLDLLLRRGNELCWVETKSITLVEEGVALFPDCPTERGQRHMRELQELSERGICAAVVFVVQREDAVAFRPNDAADPQFRAALRDAAASGVKVVCCLCQVDESGEEIVGELPVLF